MHGLAKQEPLGFAAQKRPQNVQLSFRFYSLDDNK